MDNFSLAAERRRVGVAQEELASALDRHPSVISRFENAARKAPAWLTADVYRAGLSRVLEQRESAA